MTYVPNAYFIYEEQSQELVERLEANKYGVRITSIYAQDFLDNILEIGNEVGHVVISLSSERISEFLALAHRYDFSIGIVPMASQKEEIKSLYTTLDVDENIEIALRDDAKGIDLVRVNDSLIYSQGIIGTVPLLDENRNKTRRSIVRTFLYSIKKFFSLELEKFDITTDNEQTITTAGSAIVILNHTKSSFLSRIFNFNQSIRDGKITIVIVSPSSIFEYIELITSIFSFSTERKTTPKAIGYAQSKSFTIKASKSVRVRFGPGESLPLPVTCTIVPDAIRLNASDKFWEFNEKQTNDKETIKTLNLPDKNEALTYMAHKIPLFKSASEERFKELFQILRLDAKVNSNYLVLMVLSTLLASFGLFANSTAVIIGAMLVAPLMTPIVAVAMGLLRAERKIINDSLFKIVIGILLAIMASSTLALLMPHSSITDEMMSRINPTLLDLGIAIFSGVAAAYSKSFKEITQNLAGVAIAVALVPPLSVAGIGLGYGEFSVFSGAFLLFFTNLVGIILAAVVTFQVLGFSNVVKSKKSVALVFALILAVSYPLYVSYDQIIQKYNISKMLKEQRFVVNNKYVIIDEANIVFHGDVKILNLSIAVRESLSREDLEELKKSIQLLFDTKLFIKTKVEYIL